MESDVLYSVSFTLNTDTEDMYDIDEFFSSPEEAIDKIAEIIEDAEDSTVYKTFWVSRTETTYTKVDI